MSGAPGASQLPGRRIRLVETHQPSVGVALSGGGAAAMAHVGILEVLLEAGLRVDVVAGTSFGAVVGAAFAADALSRFRDIMCTLTRGRVLRLFDPTWPYCGLIEGRRCLDLVAECLGDRIETLTVPYAAVATDLHSGDRVVLRSGKVLDAVRASIAIPGLFTPHRDGARILVDGGLVDPVPVAVARQLGARFVIAMSVLRLPPTDERISPKDRRRIPTQLLKGARLRRQRVAESHHVDDIVSTDQPPRLFDVLSLSSALIQTQIAAARLREHPPDALITLPPLRLGLFDFHRAPEVIAAGRAAATAALPGIRRALESSRWPRGPFQSSWWRAASAVVRPGVLRGEG